MNNLTKIKYQRAELRTFTILDSSLKHRFETPFLAFETFLYFSPEKRVKELRENKFDMF